MILVCVGMNVVSHLSSSSSDESTTDEDINENDESFDWNRAEDILNKEIEEQGAPLPEEAKIISNLAFLLKVPRWRDEEWITNLQKEKTKELPPPFVLLSHSLIIILIPFFE
jgi:hypothetical protein